MNNDDTHDRIAEALQRVRQLDADITAARAENKRLLDELRELRKLRERLPQ
jgi:predicted phage gp36 major capsid-like protein